MNPSISLDSLKLSPPDGGGGGAECQKCSELSEQNFNVHRPPPHQHD